MAKFAANLTMLFNEVPFLERFAAAKQAGFTAVEFLFPYAYDKQLLADLLSEHQLSMSLFNMYPGDWDNGEKGTAALPGREQEFRVAAEQALEYAIALGCNKVHAMSGIIDPQFSIDLHIDTFLSNLRWAAELYAEHGIELLIEPLNNRDVPNYFLAHQRDAAELIRQVGKPNVKLQFDTYHAQIMDGDLSRLIEELADVIGHVQIASVPERHEPSEGELNYAHLFKVLDNHYHGFIGCEYKPRHDTQSGLNWLTQLN
ncbi:2-oxo-tetronate isomerase [Ferrimonas senticii]|uniref:2-oxo-tetronate isomerase n=1 Tax=Ferrimonas senticii TaxID=394566 RepID=UPI0003F77563|nr:2-oxo-tetronate isomerase [Ferrimonas senticii]